MFDIKSDGIGLKAVRAHRWQSNVYVVTMLLLVGFSLADPRRRKLISHGR